MKRLFDILFSVLILSLSWPLFIFAAIGISFTSKGPILYPAKRVGKENHPFTMYKFRTMNVHDGSGPAVTALNDPRIFKFGNFLRATKIDELPQLFNILMGDMSFVGPRPEDPSLVEKYYQDWMLETLSIRPGLTSPGVIDYDTTQVQKLKNANAEADYGRTVLQRKLKLDLEYVRNQSFAWDMKLIVQTATMILRKLISGLLNRF